MSAANMPSRCPACGAGLQVQKLSCTSCGTEVQGNYRPCPVCALEPEARKLLDMFLRARGNLKDVLRLMNVSYPTVRQRIDEMFAAFEADDDAPDTLDILGRLRRGEIAVETAERLLRGDS